VRSLCNDYDFKVPTHVNSGNECETKRMCNWSESVVNLVIADKETKDSEKVRWWKGAGEQRVAP